MTAVYIDAKNDSLNETCSNGATKFSDPSFNCIFDTELEEFDELGECNCDQNVYFRFINYILFIIIWIIIAIIILNVIIAKFFEFDDVKYILITKGII